MLFALGSQYPQDPPPTSKISQIAQTATRILIDAGSVFEWRRLTTRQNQYGWERCEGCTDGQILASNKLAQGFGKNVHGNLETKRLTSSSSDPLIYVGAFAQKARPLLLHHECVGLEMDFPD